jgi:hypothetical protein
MFRTTCTSAHAMMSTMMKTSAGVLLVEDICIALIKGKAIPVTGRRVPYSCETSRLPHFLDNRLTDDGKVVILTRQPPFTRRKIPRTHFSQRPSRHQGHSAAGRIRSIEKSNNLIGNRTATFRLIAHCLNKLHYFVSHAPHWCPL